MNNGKLLRLDADGKTVLSPEGKSLWVVSNEDQIGGFQRTAKGLAWERKQKALQDMLGDPEQKKRLDATFKDVLVTRGVPTTQVHADQFLANLSAAYTNDDYIGERCVMVTPVPKRTGKFAVYPQREMFEAPDDSLTTERARANEISSTRTSASYELKDYGLENFVSNETLENQDLPFNERSDMVAEIAEHMARKREVRIANLITTASNYGSGNSTTLSGSDQWNQGSGGNPVKNIQDGLAALFNGPGATSIVGVTSLDSFNVLARHPQLLDLQKYTTNGLLTPEGLARYLGLDALLIGKTRRQTANEGQTAAYSRIWGNDFAILRVSRGPSLRTASFASLFRKQTDPIVTEWFDATAGKSGGYYLKNAVSEDLVVVASFGGYIIKSCIG